MIGVTIDAGELAAMGRWFGELDKAQAGANRRALVKAGKKAASLSVKEIAARVGAKQKSIRRKLKAFPAPRASLGRADVVRLWLGLRAGILPKDDKTVARQFPGAFQATMRSGRSGLFARRPNPIKRAPKSTHASPSRAGRPNPKRASLPIDKVRIILDRRTMLPILVRHAKHVTATVYPDEFRRLLELNARRAAGR